MARHISDSKSALTQAMRRSKNTIIKHHAQGIAGMLLKQWQVMEWGSGLWVTKTRLTFTLRLGTTRDLIEALVQDGWGTRQSMTGAEAQMLVPSSRLLDYLHAARAKVERDVRQYATGFADQLEHNTQLQEELEDHKEKTDMRVSALEVEIRRLREEQATMWEAIRYLEQTNPPVTGEKLRRHLKVVGGDTCD